MQVIFLGCTGEERIHNQAHNTRYGHTRHPVEEVYSAGEFGDLCCDPTRVKGTSDAETIAKGKADQEQEHYPKKALKEGHYCVKTIKATPQ